MAQKPNSFVGRRNRGRDVLNNATSSKVTDWIQAVAVVIGIAVGIWQFVIHDRDSELQRRKSVVDLIVAGQSTEIQNAYKIIIKYIIDKDSQPQPWKDGGSFAGLIPFEQYMQAWGFCYQQNLCDQKLTLLFTCSQVDVYWRLLNDSYNTLRRESILIVQEPLRELMRGCGITIPDQKRQ